MKKILLLAFCMLLTGSAIAQIDATVIKPDFDDSDNDYLYGATAYGVSANGEWVVGYGDEFTLSSFVWNRTTGAFQCITGAPYQTSDRDRSECYAVSNEGVVVGGVETKKGYLSPGYWKEGVWTLLEERNGQVSSATAISPDSRIITGHVLRTVQKTYYDFNYVTNQYDYSNPHKKDVEVYMPVQWVDGVIKQDKPSWYPDPDKVGTGIYCFHASDNGKYLALNYEHPSGSKAPAALINGKLKFFYGENDINVNEDAYFFFGETTNVSRNGKYFCGYFTATGSAEDVQGFVYDVAKDELVEVAGLPSVIMNDGTYYTASSEMGFGVMGISADARVFCGYKTENTELGTIPYPVIYTTKTVDDKKATFAPASTTPAVGSTVDELSVINFNFGEAADYNYENEAELQDANGAVVTTGKFGYSDNKKMLTLTLAENVTKKGTYTLVIPYNTIGNTEWANELSQPGNGNYNSELRYEYSVSGRICLTPTAIDPKEGSTIAQSGGNVFRLTFDSPIKVDATKKPALKLSTYGTGTEGTLKVDANDSKVAVITIPEDLTPNKEYTLSIPSGSISTADDAYTCNQLSYTYKTGTIGAVYDITFEYLTPAKGEVAEGESLETFYINASQDWYDKKGVASDVKFYKHGTNEEVTTLKKVTYSTADYRQVKLQLSEPVTATGVYDLYIPQGFLGDQAYLTGAGGHANKAQRIAFYIGCENTPVLDVAGDNSKLTIYDLNGRMVMLDASKTDLHSLPRGIYCIGKKKHVVR